MLSKHVITKLGFARNLRLRTTREQAKLHADFPHNPFELNSKLKARIAQYVTDHIDTGEKKDGHG